MNLEFALTRKALAIDQNGDVITDSPVALRVWNKAGRAVTSVTVDNTAETLDLIDSAGTTSISLNGSTVSALAAAIKVTTGWDCKVLDALLTDSVDDTLVDGAVTAAVRPNGVTVWDLKSDTSASLNFSFCAAVDREVGTENVAKTNLHRVNLFKFNYLINVGTAADDMVQVWLRTKENIESKLLSRLSVDNSATTVFDTSASNHAWLSAPEGGQLICRVKDAATLADASGNILSVLYQVE